MKKILIAAAAVAAFAGAAGSAAAQSWDYGSGQFENRQNVLRDRIENGERSGRITPRESRTLRAELRDIREQGRHFRASRGIDRQEYAVLSQRLDRLHYRIDRQAANRDDTRYGYGYGRDYDRYDRGGRGW